MSYTNPHGQPQGVAILDTNKLREILIAEICAINDMLIILPIQIWKILMKFEEVL
ncbi:hypothetical protein [Clostridium sp. Marseille-QA1073]